MKKCPYCAEEIQDDAIKCRYCDEWLDKIEPVISEPDKIEPEKIETVVAEVVEAPVRVEKKKDKEWLNKDEINFTPTGESKQKHDLISWKSLVAAFFIAVFLNVFLSAVAGVEPRKNVIWTTLWIYLSIVAWKYWRWKALLPYPLFVLLTVLYRVFISSYAPGTLLWSYIVVVLINIGGLIIFYLLLLKEIKKQNRNDFPSLVMKKGIDESRQPLSPDSSAKSNGKPGSKFKIFLIPTIIVILLPLLTVSLVYFERNKETPNVVERYGHFVKYDTGVVKDTSTGLEWYAGPDRYINWDEAKLWVEGLNVAGGDWRMPTRNELEVLYQKGVGTRNMTPLLKTTGRFVWTNESKDSLAYAFNFRNGPEYWHGRNGPMNIRVFAVRSQ